MVFSVIPKRSASLLIIDPLTNKLLLLKRNKNISFGNQHAFPGGALEETDFEYFKV
jgi:hypothetical protein